MHTLSDTFIKYYIKCMNQVLSYKSSKVKAEVSNDIKINKHQH